MMKIINRHDMYMILAVTLVSAILIGGFATASLTSRIDRNIVQSCAATADAGKINDRWTQRLQNLDAKFATRKDASPAFHAWLQECAGEFEKRNAERKAAIPPPECKGQY